MEKIILLSLIAVFLVNDPIADKYSEIPNKEAIIIWTADRPLSWEDFQGTPRGRAHIGATTHATIKTIPEVNRWSGRVSVQVQAIFNCSKSWVRAEAKENPELLEHEQHHFDIAEVYAQKIRQALQQYKITYKNYPQIRAEVIEPLFREYDRYDREYDRSTVHGLDKEAQKQWEEEIEEQL